MTNQTELFSGINTLQWRQQFRMRRLQVYNWGTFSDLHDINIAEQGFLFVGRSGSGKSTLLDALTALLIPPQWQVFNAAAREGERKRQDRNLVSYIRGAWGEQKDTNSGLIASQFLRKGTTWSALALSFGNGEGRHVSLIQLYWLKGASTANPEVKRHYMIAERPFDMAKELAEFDLDVRTLKHRLTDVEHFGNVFRPYGERFRRIMDIESDMALKLLHKTQSAKNLGDLNDFLRQFMLDEPKTFEVAERLVSEFAELDAAHQEVVTARRQVDTLKPARSEYEKYQELDKSISDHEFLLEGIDSYCDGIRFDLLEGEIVVLTTREQGLNGQVKQMQEKLADLKDTLVTLEAEHRQKGGSRIEDLERKKTEVEGERDNRQRNYGRVVAACKTLGWTMPDNPHVFSERVSEARHIAEKWSDTQGELNDERDGLRDKMKAVEQEFTGVRKEIEAMERQPSNIPSHMLELREEIATALGYAESDLPFIGELIQVKKESAQWCGAIERVLHGFALSMLVDEKRYPAVSKYVDETDLGRKLIYYRVGNNIPYSQRQPAINSLFHKLELKETGYQEWLETELTRRFDYTCVETMHDFRRESKAITLNGQVRSGKERHEKDDRYRIDDRRRWVLGFDNKDKLAVYRERAGILGAEISDFDKQIRELEKARDKQQEYFQACTTLIKYEWQEIDIGGSLDRIHQIEQQLRELREGNPDLKKLGERIEQQKQQMTDKESELLTLQVETQDVVNKIKGYREQHENIEEKLETARQPEPRHREMLAEHFEAAGEVTLSNLDKRKNAVERAINKTLTDQREARAGCVNKMEKAFADFKREWPQAGADFDATLASANDFLALLQRLEWDGLPKHEKRFFKMLKEQSHENLAALTTHISQERKKIGDRMELVNDGLTDADFNQGTYLQIDTSERDLPDVKEFRKLANRVLDHAWQMEPDSSEERFLDLRKLVQKLGQQEDAAQRHWREHVLDVRLHVEFIGKELDRQDDRELEVYRSGAGKSGGQREKLSTTCLAAALRYQLGGSDGALPVYAPVVLDEAFGKADNEFTELAMRIFEKFGFQMIVATPLKSVMTLEPFIGGACFVEIVDRKRSATLPIEYDTQQQRLKLPTHTHGEETPA